MAPTRDRTLSRAGALGALVVLAALASATVASAETRALLIGVGHYPGLGPTYQMTAPAQDVRRLAASLVATGLEPSTLTLLTDDGDGPGPDREALLGALAALEQTAGPGDRILLYFSGHGGQRPATWPDLESDGLEEVWLAADARLDRDGTVTDGYLADHQIAAAIRRMRLAGADVWLVVDACYAGGVTRSVGEQVKAGPGSRRLVVAGQENSSPIHFAEEAGGQGLGRFAAFYAADARTLALAGPAGSPFTSALARALDGGRTGSLADLAAGVLAVDARLGVNAPRPVFEGALEGSVLGLEPHRSRRFAIRRLDGQAVIGAGVEEGLAVGDWVETEDADGRALGTVAVQTIDLGFARLEAGVATDAVAGRVRPGIRPATTPAGRLLAAITHLGGRWSSDLEVTARLERPSAAFCDALVDPGQPGPDATPVTLTALPLLEACDRLYLRVQNRGLRPLDVSILYLAAHGGVVGPGLYPTDDARIRPGEWRDVAFRIVAEPDEVTERIAVVATPARSRFALDLRYLARPGAVPDSRGGAEDWWREVLEPGTRRSATSSAPVDTVVAVAFPVRVASMTENVSR